MDTRLHVSDNGQGELFVTINHEPYNGVRISVSPNGTMVVRPWPAPGRPITIASDNVGAHWRVNGS
jgi:hypothetical protein